jgi:hypothetical protein
MEELAVSVLALFLLLGLGRYLRYRHEKWTVDIYTNGWKYASSSFREKTETYDSLEAGVRLAKEMGIYNDYHRGIENYLSIIPPFKRLQEDEPDIVP